MRWKADSFQGTLFTGGAQNQIDALDAWKLLSGGTNPESYQRPGISPIGQSTASGKIAGHQMTVNTQFGRVDVIFTPPELQGRPKEAPQFEDYHPVIEDVVVFTSVLLPRITVTRVALVVEFSFHLGDIGEAASVLSQATNISFPEGASDLIYQYNKARPYQSNPGIIMNRVHTYSVGFKQLISGQIDLSNPTQAQMTTPLFIIPFVNLKLDFNSQTSSDITSIANPLMLEHIREVINTVPAY